MKKILKMLRSRKGDIALIGIIITITAAVFIQGYLDTINANYILDESQSILDLTALTALESSVDTEGLRYERMTIRPYNYDYEENHVNQTQNGGLLTGNDGYIDPNILASLPSSAVLAKQKEVYDYSIWLDGTNAYHIEHECQAKISNRIKENFLFYMDEFLYSQLVADGVNILDYDVIAFTGTLTYDNWGINRKYHNDTITFEDIETELRPDGSIAYKHANNYGQDLNGNPLYGSPKTTNDYIKMPQATIDATIRLVVDVDPTFTTAFYNYTLYNAQKTSNNYGIDTILGENAGGNNYNVSEGTYLIDSGFNTDNNLVLTIRVLARQTFY